MTWFSRLFRTDATPPVTFNTAGMYVKHRAPGRIAWKDHDGDELVLAIEADATLASSGPPDLEALRAEARQEADGGLVTAEFARAGRIPVARIITKQRDGLGSICEGQVRVPLKNGRATISRRALEQGTTGVREATVTSFLFGHGVLRVPTGPLDGGPMKIEGWFLDPYDAAWDDGAICALSDDERLDDLFDQHPLTRVRRWLADVVDTIHLDDSVRPEGLADGSSPSTEGTRITQRLPSSILGQLYLMAGRMDQAEVMFLQSLRLDHGEPADSSAEVAETLTLLGLVREMQGKVDAAEWALLRAHRMFAETAGAEDLRTARAAGHLARVRVCAGRFGEAEPMVLRVLPIFETQGNDVDVAVTLNDLGLIRQATGAHVEVIALFERAAGHFEKAEQAQGSPTPIARRCSTTWASRLTPSATIRAPRAHAAVQDPLARPGSPDVRRYRSMMITGSELPLAFLRRDLPREIQIATTV